MRLIMLISPHKQGCRMWNFVRFVFNSTFEDLVNKEMRILYVDDFFEYLKRFPS